MKQIFAKKPLSVLLEEMKGENRLRRILGPAALTSLGVGAIIGTGIFVLTGVAAHDKAGPAVILSFVFAGIACIPGSFLFLHCRFFNGRYSDCFQSRGNLFQLEDATP